MLEVRRMADEQRLALEHTQQMLQHLTESILATLRDLIEENAQLRAENHIVGGSTPPPTAVMDASP